MANTSRSTIEKLQAAKSVAVERFLSPRPAEMRRDVAMLASGRHEDNVVGVGIGRKVVNGRETARTAIRFYVRRKIGKKALAESMLLPAKVDGVATDVVETGEFKALPAGAAARANTMPLERRRMRPAKPGCSVGFQFTGANAGYVMAGTFGAVVTSDGKLFILSNNHVLANENELAVGAPIFQPGLLDGGDPKKDLVAKLARFVPLDADHPNEVDAAIAEAFPDRKVLRATVLPKVGKLASGEPLAATPGMPVMKVGRTTGFATGTIFDIAADVRVGYEMGDILFRDQLIVVGDGKPFSDSGDSGSLVVARKPKQPVGLLFAGSKTHTICNPIGRVLSALDVVIVT